MKKNIMEINVRQWMNIPLLMCMVAASSLGDSKIIFNQPVDHRYAWIGNEAEGGVNFRTELINMIRDANVSIDVSSMSFSDESVAAELAAAAERGVAVRINGNAGHRFQPGYHGALKGPVQETDNNLPALVYRVNFQHSGSTAAAGFLTDTGETFGPKPGGVSYGWSDDVGAQMQSLTGTADYATSLLGDVYVQPNSMQRTWEIGVDNGYYYAYVMAGHPAQGCNTNVKLQNNPIFYKNDDPGFDYVAYTDADKHESSPVAGGRDDGNLNGQRVQVSDGRLRLTVGYPSVPGNSCVDFIEIYRGSDNTEGDDGTDKRFVQQKQLVHAKYLIFDAGTPGQKLWSSSGNLTGGLTDMSEDALITDETGVINAFQKDFNNRWGTSALLPDPANAKAGRFKPAPLPSETTVSIVNTALGTSFPWHIYFSPTNAAYNLYEVPANFIDSTHNDLIFLLEQFTGSGDITGTPYGTLYGTDKLRELHLKDQFLDLGKELYGVFGNENPADEIFAIGSYPKAHITQVPWSPTYSIHTKAVLSDALNDTRHSLDGRVLMGSMNWSQSAMHYNDEQTVVIEDPMLANQYLQRAMAALEREHITPPPEADIIVVLDRSYSMNDATPSGTTKIEATRMAASLFIDLLDTDAGHRASLVRFGETVEPFSPPLSLAPLIPSYAETLKGDINATQATLPIGNHTCYGCGLGEALSQFLAAASPNPRRVIHFFTDGKQNYPPNAEAVKDDLYDAGIEIHSTAFGDFDLYGGGPTAILAELASESGGTFAQLPDDPMLLQKRFAEVARDAIAYETVLDPSYRLDRERDAFEASFFADKGMRTLKIMLMWDRPVKGLANLKLTSPGGDGIDPAADGVRLIDAAGYQLWRLDLKKLERSGIDVYGRWNAVGRGEKVKAPATVDLMVIGSGGTDFKAEAFFIPKNAKKVQLLARAMAEGETIRDMRVNAVWTQPGKERRETKIALFDDGRHGDNKRGDGIFGNSVQLEKQGNHAFRFIANGIGEHRFQREETQYVTTRGRSVKEPVKPPRIFWERLRDWLIFWK